MCGRGLSTLIFLVLCVGLSTSLSLMATTYNESQALAGGTLYYTVDVISGTCYYTGATPPKPVSFTTYDYEIFSYTDSNSLSWGLSGSGSYNYVNNPYGSPNNCPSPGPHPSTQITLTGGWGFNVGFELCDYLTCPSSYTSIPAGYIDPKYIVAAEVYAPPGPQSSVTYGSALQTGDTTSISSSFTSSTTVSETSSTVFNASITPFHHGIIGLGGKSTNTATEESSQSQGSSSTFTTDLKSSSSYQTPGMPVTWTGWFTSGFNPHDYDWAWLWLNAAMPSQTPSSSSVAWFGYGYDACDPAIGLDIYNVINGNLENGGGGIPGLFLGVQGNPSISGVLKRDWATPAGAQEDVAEGRVPSDCDGQTFASGDSSALGSADFTNILAADPLLNEGYQLDLTSSSNYTETGDGRYTRSPAFIDPSTGQVTTTYTDFPFVQAACAGCNPPSETYSSEYQGSTQIGASTDYKTTQTFGTDNAFSASAWLISFSESLSTSNSVATDYETKSDITTTTSNYGQFTIVGPPCNPGGNPCAQVYGGPGEFDVYQDNKFATFMFWPVQ